ncbi:MAG: MDR family oxidoreductase [Actinomycetes bacterium]
MTFTAVVAEADGPAQIRQLSDDDLPEGDVTVDVRYSSLNYKDGLAVMGKGKVVRSFPLVCGIDLAGAVSASDSAGWQVGDEVVVTGWGLSETHPGGYTGRQRVRSEWLVRRPDRLNLAQTMAIGTAGLTAALCIDALEARGLDPGDEGEVLVTGAAGGVGSVAVALLAAAGYRVAASTGRPEAAAYLQELGATTIVERSELAVDPERPLEKERWAGAVDTVGSTTLGTVLRQTRYRGAVAACGLAGGNDLPATVLPFILRNVALLGVDSNQCPTPVRQAAWDRIQRDLPLEQLDRLTTTEPLARVPDLAQAILGGQIRGRVVIDTTA